MGELPWSVRLLGRFELHRGDGAPVTVGSGRAEVLLGFVLIHRDRPVTRHQVAQHLWPDSTEAQAMTNLRHVLHDLRRSCPGLEQYLDATLQRLCWRRDMPCDLDVARFEDAIAGEAWAYAVEAYGGDLLTGHDEEWLQEERARLRRRYLDALENAASAEEIRGQPGRALPYAERLLREDPLREASYRLLIRLYDAAGDRARAVRAYHECAATLERELGVEPATDTRAAYDALLARDTPCRATVTRFGGSPFVGRSVERAALADAWRRVKQDGGRLVLLTGEAGIGKTRLAEEFRAWCAHRGAVTALAGAYPGEGALAYGPIIIWLRADAVNARLTDLPPPHLTELTRLLPELLTAMPGLDRPDRLPERDQRRRLYDAVGQALAPRGRPVVLVADDVQWWDREALQLLHYLVRTRSPLIVGTARREDIEDNRPLLELLRSLRAAGTVSDVELDRLTPPETALLADRLGDGRLSVADTEALHQQTEGNPLFVVEALRAGWPSGGPLTPRVQAVIESRLAQLSESARNLVDVAATIGTDFTTELLSAAAQWDQDAVLRGLDELWRRRIIREHGATAYQVSHERIRECAYAGLSPIRRRQLHAQVARALERVPASHLDEVSGQLAHHHEQAGSVEDAVTAYARAADVAQRVHAHGEAARLLTRALTLLRSLPGTPERRARVLELTTLLLAPLVATEGYASPHIHEAHQRALALADSLGKEPAPPLLRSLGLGSLASGDFVAAREYGEALQKRGERDDDDVLRVEGDYLLGVAAFWAGELPEARRHLERAVASYRDDNREEHLLRYAQDPRVVCLTRLALTHWFLGDREAAIRARDEGLEVAEEIRHPYSLIVGLQFAALLALDMGDLPAVRRYVARGKAAMPDDGGIQLSGGISALDAYLKVLDEHSSAGVARIRELVTTATRTDQAAPGLRSALLRILLAACEAAGDADTGLAAAEELIALTNSVVWRPEAERLREMFLAMQRAANA